MEVEQIIKQLDWLDEERRKDKSRLTALEERFSALDGNFVPVLQQSKDLSSEMIRISGIYTRLDNLDQALLQTRVENKQALEEFDKQIRKREDENDKLRRAEMRSLENSLSALRKDFDQVAELKRNMKARLEEETRLGRLIDELRTRQDTLRREGEELIRTARLVDESRRQDAKRITDIQGEVNATRKRLEDQINKLDLSGATVKKLENRLTELMATEGERRDSMTSFLSSQALKNVERERQWKEWQSRSELIQSQTAQVENALQNLDAAQLSVKRSQQSIDELAQKVERRINELTEMSRLSEERFRQDWSTFKVDDQKRWGNYTLTSDEQRNELQRQHNKLADRVDDLDDRTLSMKDHLDQANEMTEERMQNLLAMVHDWATQFEKSLGRKKA